MLAAYVKYNSCVGVQYMLVISVNDIGSVYKECLLYLRVKNVSYTLYRKLYFCIPRNETARPHSQSYIHVSVSNLYIPRIGLPIWLQQNRQT
jgi:hypothetical protein